MLPFFAMAVLLLGISATLYVNANQATINVNQDSIIVNGISYDVKTLFDQIEWKTIQTDDGERSGIPTDKLISYTNISCPSNHSYTFIATDGYQQTVPWEYIQQGVFTEEKRVFFPNLAHAFWVRDVFKIEVD